MDDPLRQALLKSRAGNITINTPYAASDLHSTMVDEFGLDFDIVRLKRVEFANIVFTVKNVAFNFTFNPGHKFTLSYRHMEAEKWMDANFQETDDDLQHLLGIIRDKVFENTPSPV